MRLIQQFEPWYLALRETIFPIFCKQCGVRLLTEENGFFCPTCWESSARVTRPYCSCCGKPHQQMVGFGSLANFPCAACRERPNPHIRRVYGAALYEGAVAEGIKLLKFQDKERLADALGDLLVEFIQQELEVDRYHLIIPVPLHKVRLRARGFNQSRLLAERILPCFPGAALDESLRRIRPTRTQSKLKGTKRKGNVKGAFAVAGDNCTGCNILLVDDVVTTMGTVTECAASLKRAGALSVDVLAVALANHSFDHLS